MTDIEQRLTAAMHAAVDRVEEAMPEDALRGIRRRHRRHSILVAGLAILIAVGVAVPAVIAARTLTQAPAPATHHSPRLPTKLTGLPMPAGTNFQLLVRGNDQAEWYSTASRHAEVIHGLPAEPYDFGRVPGGWTVTLFLGGWTCPPHCWNGQYFIADGSTRATRIGIGWKAVAADRPGEVWLMSYPHTIVNMAKAAANVQLFTTTGRALGPRYRLPEGYRLTRGVGSYLLLRPWLSKPPSTSVLWNPRSNRIVGRFTNVIDTGPDDIAWVPACRGCHVRILNVQTGKTATTPIRGLVGRFTDDGTLLAIQEPNGQLVIYDTRSRALTVIPGTVLNNSSWESFGWPNGSHTLVVTAGPGRDYTTGPEGPDQLAYWQPGDALLRITSVVNGGEIGAVQNWGLPSYSG